MDDMNMAIMVNLSGGWGDKIKNILANINEHYPNIFVVFANVDFDGVGSDDWTENAIKQLEIDVARGVEGLKIYRSLGLEIKMQKVKG